MPQKQSVGLFLPENLNAILGLFSAKKDILGFSSFFFVLCYSVESVLQGVLQFQERRLCFIIIFGQNVC